MKTPQPEQPKISALIPALREGVSLIQMVFFKELRERLRLKYSDKESTYHSMLTGAILNELFGTQNPEKKFQQFRQENLAVIEQELMDVSREHETLRPFLTDALRVQTLCDQQEGTDSSSTLLRAEELGILIHERDLPLPSIFMTRVRSLGEKYGLTLAPVQISKEDDEGMVH